MSKRTIYTIITPLPPTVSRSTAIAALHHHSGMISLSPVVIDHELTKPLSTAPADEFHCTWYNITDRISYLPGVKGTVSYKVCFHNLPNGMQSHCYAPAGLDIKGKWSVGGNEPGEEREVRELGLIGVPREGLYLREDVDMKCNMFLIGFVKKTLKKSHEVLVDRLLVQADLTDDQRVRETYVGVNGGGLRKQSLALTATTTATSPGAQTAFDMSRSSSMKVAGGGGGGPVGLGLQEMPAGLPDPDVRPSAHRASSYTSLSSRTASVRSGDGAGGPYDRRVSIMTMPRASSVAAGTTHEFIAELPEGNTQLEGNDSPTDWTMRKEDVPSVMPLRIKQRAELP